MYKVGKNHCDLRWQPPRSDGGARVTGYDVEYREYPEGSWVSQSKLNYQLIGEKVREGSARLC